MRSGGGRWRGRLGPFQEAAFTRFFLSVAISAIGDRASLVALSFGILAIGDPTDLGLVLLAREIPIVLLLLAGGVYADRLPRRLVLAGSYGVRGATQLGTAAVFFAGTGSIAAIAALQAVNGAATAFSRPASTGFLPEIVSAERLQQGNALLGMSRDVTVLGAAVGAALVTLSGAGWALVFDAMTFAVSALLILGVGRGAAPPKATSSPLADLREGWHAVRSRTWVWVMILTFGTFQLAYFPAFLVLGPTIADAELGGAGAWAAILIAEAVGGIAGAAVALRRSFGRPLMVINVIGFGTIAELLLLAAGAPVWTLVIAAVAGGAGFAISNALWFTAMQRLLPHDQISRVSSFDWLGSMAMNPIGYALVGPLAAAYGAPAVLVAASAVIAATCLVPLATGSIRNLRLPPPAVEPTTA